MTAAKIADRLAMGTVESRLATSFWRARRAWAAITEPSLWRRLHRLTSVDPTLVLAVVAGAVGLWLRVC